MSQKKLPPIHNLVVAALLPPIVAIAGSIGLLVLIFGSSCIPNAIYLALSLLSVALGASTFAFWLCNGVEFGDLVAWGLAACVAWAIVGFALSNGQIGLPISGVIVTGIFALPGIALSAIASRFAWIIAVPLPVGGVVGAVVSYQHLGQGNCGYFN